MSDTQWYYSDANAQQQGPYLAEQIQQLVASGTITQETQVWHDGLENWTAAVEVQGLFATTAPAPAPVVSKSPYAAPAQTQLGVAPTGGEFPIPFVKKSSFGLLIGFYILGIVLIMIGLFLIFSLLDSTKSDPPYQGTDLRHIEDAGAPAEPEVKESGPQGQPDHSISDTEAIKTLSAVTLLVIGSLCITFGGIYAYVILYRAWHAIQAGGAQTTPGKAVGFMFIPVFSLYWMFIAFHGWSTDWTRIRSSYSNLMAAPAVSTGTFLAGCILMIIFPLVGIFLFFSMMAQMCGVTNYMASAYALSKTQSSGLTGTRFY